MDRSVSRLQAPRANANAYPHANANAKRGSAGSSSGGVPSFGLRRPSGVTPHALTPNTNTNAPRRRVSRDDPPRLALHELTTPPKTTASSSVTTFLRRGSGKTIATIGNPSAAVGTPTPTPTPTPLRRKSGSPRAKNGAAPTSVDCTPSGQDSEPTIRDGATKMELPTTAPLSPETFLRQRKRSADMMDPFEPMLRPSPTPTNGTPDATTTRHHSAASDKVDEPPAPMTPPPRNSVSHEYGENLPVSPREMKRLRRLTRSPKTPLGTSTYHADGGGLSATQRVRLSLSGYVTVASLTGGERSARRESGAGTLNAGLLSAGDDQAAASASSDGLAASKTARPQSASRALDASRASLARSKFAASRSMSGPAQIASVLIPSSNSLDCLMGYIQELQRSEATLRGQLHKIRKQRHDELSRSTVHVNALEMTITQVESERERERRRLEEQERTIQMLMNEMAKLQQSVNQRMGDELADTQFSYQDQTQLAAQVQQDGDTHTDVDTSSQWANHNHNADATDHAGYSNEPLGDVHPESSYQTPPPSGSGGYYQQPQQYATAGDTPYYSQDGAPAAGDVAMAPPPEQWTGEQAGYYQDCDYYQQQYASDGQAGEGYQPEPSSDGQWTDPDAGCVGSSSAYQSETDPTAQNTAVPAEWTNYEYQNYSNGSSNEYGAPSAAPLSPVATLNGSWRPQAPASVHAHMDAPPMFRVAPRLSDIIAPLSRSVVGPSAATDHNVLKSVTPQALSVDSKQPRGQATPSPTVADREFMMTPPRLGPPAFSMSGFRSGSDKEAPPSKPKCVSGIVSNQNLPHVNSTLSEPVNAQEEQFVPAEQVFKPFQKPKTPTRKAPLTPSKGGLMLSKDVMKGLLIEFFTNVDKTRLRMVEGYTRRYQGEEAKLFTELTKRYGVEKVAELQRRFVDASNPPVEESETLQETSQLPQASESSSPVAQFGERCQPEEAPVGNAQHLYAVRPPVQYDATSMPPRASHQPEHAPPTYFDGSYAQNASNEVEHEQSTDEYTTFAPPTAAASPSHKVSPKGVRRGPPLPFAFDESPGQHAESEMLPPPPQVHVTGPPTMAPPPRSPVASSPPRLAPTPPRAPPPPSSERSPVRNASILRQRVSPQKIAQPLSKASGPPPAGFSSPPPTQPLMPGASPSPAKPTGPSPQPVTLEMLLNDFYRKHQPDRVKNIPEVVKQYSGKERELITLLKKKYGALSIKRLEQNLELLERQSQSAAATTNGAASQQTMTKKQSRGCFGRLATLLIKLIFLRLTATVVLLGGLVALDHSQCQRVLNDSIDTELEGVGCQPLEDQLAAFTTWRLTHYAQRVESRECFCELWIAREEALSKEPSLAHAGELLMLVPFSRTIAEPAYYQFVDTYLPDLSYGEYYQSYATPAVELVKEYGGIGYVYAKEAFTEVSTRAAELPWAEYYASYGAPTVHVAHEYAIEALKYGEQLYEQASAVGGEQWSVLVEMYNEEGAVVAKSETNSVEKGSDAPSPMEVLTKAAMASKWLAEPHDSVPEEVNSVVETEAWSAEHSVSETAAAADSVAAETHETDATVEVVVEQNGLDLAYLDATLSHTEIGNDELQHDVLALEVPERVGKSELDAAVEVEKIVAEVEEEAVSDHPEAVVDHDEKPAVGMVDVVATATGDVTASVEGTVVDAEADAVGVKAEDGGPKDQQTMDEATVENAMVEGQHHELDVQLDLEPVAERPVAEEQEFANEIAVESVPVTAEPVVIEAVEKVQLANEVTIESDYQVIVDVVGSDTTNSAEESQTVASAVESANDLHQEVEQDLPPPADGHVDSSTVDSAEEEEDVVGDTVVDHEEEQEQDTSEASPLEFSESISVTETSSEEQVSEPASTLSDEVAHADSERVVAEEAPLAVVTEEEIEQSENPDEEPSFLEDLSELDPLDLLDLADLAAAELHSIN